VRLLRNLALAGAFVCLVAGAAIVVIQSFWITYGVFVRYVLKNPDSMVTEATALLLIPLAFLGLPYAMKDDAFPRVTFVTDKLPPRAAFVIGRINIAIMVLVGLFFVAVTINATVSTFRSGASSSVLGWPEFAFWAPVAVASVAFVVYAVYDLFSARRGSPSDG
jgi:TRAP-type C4-dicarboxylate transport system permease small subunit